MSMESQTRVSMSPCCPPTLRTVGGPVALLGSMAALAMACTNKPAPSHADADERCDAESTASVCDAEATSPDAADASSDPMSPDVGPADVVSETDPAVEDARGRRRGATPSRNCCWPMRGRRTRLRRRARSRHHDGHALSGIMSRARARPKREVHAQPRSLPTALSPPVWRDYSTH